MPQHVVPTAALALLQERFLCRTDFLAFRAPWDRPCPGAPLKDVEGLLLTHLQGEDAPPAPLQYQSRGHAVLEQGHYRLGAYTPALDGTTKWLCLDFDGGDHAAALADPGAEALALQATLAKAGFPSYLELSASGKGWHLWCFFDPPVEARLARGLALALLPAELALASGETVQANTGRVIEIFPKQSKIEPDGYGNLVWLPWWAGASWPANQFHQLDEAGALVPFVPEDLATSSPEQVEAFVTAARSEAREERRTAREEAKHEAWRAWEAEVLGKLRLEDVYGAWLTGERSGPSWLECRDPWSPTGDRDPSAGVADGTGRAERGEFHSFVTGKSLSVFDFLVARGEASDFPAACRKVSELTGVPLPGTRPEASEFPRIPVNLLQLREVIDEAWGAVLARNEPPVLFLRGDGTVAHVRRKTDEEEGLPSYWLESATSTFMRGRLLRSADWVNVGERGERPAKPPDGLAEDMLELPDARLPPLAQVISAPMFGRYGQLIATPGYHRHERVWYEPSEPFDLEGFSETPSAAQIAAARELLREVYCDFPFASEADRAHILAATLQPAARRLIQGPTMLYSAEAPIIGSGKGMLCDAVSIIHTGEPCHVTTLPRDDDECRKRITSELAQGRPIILLDNADEKRDVHYPSLAAVLTSRSWSDRQLGENLMLSLPNRATWFITANNPSFSMELARRTVRVRIDPRQEEPWLREGFRHSPLLDWVRQNRAALLRAVLTLIQAWIAAGKPLHQKRIGSFESWSGVMGGILDVAGVPGFLGQLKESYAAADPRLAEWRQFVMRWWETYQGKPVTTRELLGLAVEHDLLGSVIGSGKSFLSQASLLGRGLASIRDRQIGEWRVDIQHDGHSKTACYRLLPGDPREDRGALRGASAEESPAQETAPSPLPESPGEAAGLRGALSLSLAREADSGSITGAPGGTEGEQEAEPRDPRVSRETAAQTPPGSSWPRGSDRPSPAGDPRVPPRDDIPDPAEEDGLTLDLADSRLDLLVESSDSAPAPGESEGFAARAARRRQELEAHLDSLAGLDLSDPIFDREQTRD